MQLNGSTLRKAAVALNLALLCWFNCTTVVIGGNPSTTNSVAVAEAIKSSKLKPPKLKSKNLLQSIISRATLQATHKKALGHNGQESVAAKAEHEHEHADPKLETALKDEQPENKSVLQRTTQVAPNQSPKRERVLQSNTLVASRDSSIKSTPVSRSVLRRKSSSQEPQPSSAMYSKKSIQKFFGGLVPTADEQHKEVQLYYLAGIVYFMYLETVACSLLAIGARLAKQPDLDLMMHEAHDTAENAFDVANTNYGIDKHNRATLQKMFILMDTAATSALHAETIVFRHYNISTKNALDADIADEDEQMFEREVEGLRPVPCGGQAEEAFNHGQYRAFKAAVKRREAGMRFAWDLLNKIKVCLYKKQDAFLAKPLTSAITNPITTYFAKSPFAAQHVSTFYYFAGMAYGILEVSNFVCDSLPAIAESKLMAAKYGIDELNEKRKTALQQKQIVVAAVTAVIKSAQDSTADKPDQAALIEIETRMVAAVRAELALEATIMPLFPDDGDYSHDDLKEIAGGTFVPSCDNCSKKDHDFNSGRFASLQALIKRIPKFVGNSRRAFYWASRANSAAMLRVETEDLDDELVTLT